MFFFWGPKEFLRCFENKICTWMSGWKVGSIVTINGLFHLLTGLTASLEGYNLLIARLVVISSTYKWRILGL